MPVETSKKGAAAHPPRHAVYALEAIGLLGIGLGRFALTLIRHWSLR